MRYSVLSWSPVARLVEGKKALENAGGFKTESILCVGGGSKTG